MTEYEKIYNSYFQSQKDSEDKAKQIGWRVLTSMICDVKHFIEDAQADGFAAQLIVENKYASIVKQK